VQADNGLAPLPQRFDDLRRGFARLGERLDDLFGAGRVRLHSFV
jgi:hypothetical protein